MKRAIILSISLMLSSGCTYSLKMQADIPPKNDSVSAFQLSSKKIIKLMIIPPQGTVRGGYDAQIALLERGLLKIGTPVFTAALTARVSADINKKNEKCCDTGAVAASLSDVERALIMAKESGADAILQIGFFDWSAEANLPSRYFIRNGDAYFEATYKQYFDHKGPKYFFSAEKLAFIGRLIDTQNGEVLASFNITCYTNWTLPGEYNATVAERWGSSTISAENYTYGSKYYWPNSKQRTEEKVIQEIVKTISSKVKA